MDSPRQENTGTGVERILYSFDKKIYSIKKSQLKLLMDKNKQEVLNNIQIYMNAEVNLMFKIM